MSTENDEVATAEDAEKNALSKRLEGIAWGLFVIMIGGLWLAPEGAVPAGAWLIGAGVIMLGLNGARYANGIKMSGFTIVLGILALALGVSAFFGADLPFFPILAILFGVSIIVEALTKSSPKRTDA